MTTAALLAGGEALFLRAEAGMLAAKKRASRERRFAEAARSTNGRDSLVGLVYGRARPGIG